MRYSISFDQWYVMTAEQRQAFINQTGGNFVLDLSDPLLSQSEFQSDKDEYLDDMSLGGEIYREPR